MCSHLEGYIEELAGLAIARIEAKRLPKDRMPVRFRYHLSRDFMQEIKVTEEPDKIALKVLQLLARDDHIWDNSKLFRAPLSVETFVYGFGTPKHDNIRRVFRRFGFSAFHHELAKNLQRDFQVCVVAIDNVVAQRNNIAHGDFSAGGSPDDLAIMSNQVKLYCRTTDQIVGDWFKSKGCAIR